MHPYIIILLMLPLIGVVVFFVLPHAQAIVSYLVILVISVVLYRVLVRTMRKRPEHGMERLVGSAATVVSKLRPRGGVRYMVKFRGELWSADSSDQLMLRDTVTITAVDGFKLIVGKTPVRPSSITTKEPVRAKEHLA